MLIVLKKILFGQNLFLDINDWQGLVKQRKESVVQNETECHRIIVVSFVNLCHEEMKNKYEAQECSLLGSVLKVPDNVVQATLGESN